MSKPRTKTIDGVTLYRRPPSSACIKGAWSSDYHHTHYKDAMWAIYETGIGIVGWESKVSEAQKRIAKLELSILDRFQSQLKAKMRLSANVFARHSFAQKLIRLRDRKLTILEAKVGDA